MPLPNPVPGLVLHYGYLWHNEHARGQEEGIKDRPSVIISVRTTDNRDLDIRVVPVTHQPPRDPNQAVEIPSATKARLGLDDQPSWIIVTEFNIFRWPGMDLRLIPGKSPASFAYGVIPPGLFRQVKDGIINAANHRQLKATLR